MKTFNEAVDAWFTKNHMSPRDREKRDTSRPLVFTVEYEAPVQIGDMTWDSGYSYIEVVWYEPDAKAHWKQVRDVAEAMREIFEEGRV